MAKKMGNYCKADYLSDFRTFSGWAEAPGSVKREKQVIEGKETEHQRPMEERDILYLQENYFVTDGIFLEEHVIFDKVTPEWIEFCTNTLKFVIPDHSAAHK